MKITEVAPSQVKEFVKTRLSKESSHIVEKFTKEELALLVQAMFFNEQELKLDLEEEEATKRYIFRKEIAYQVICVLLDGSKEIPYGSTIKDERDWCRYFQIE